MTNAESDDVPDLIVSNDGEVELMRIDFKAELTVPRIWHLRLFDNNIVPDRDVTLSDLVEVTWSGYAAVPLDPATWTTPIKSGGQAVTYYGGDFTFFTPVSGSHTVYGYYITFNNGAKLLWVQRFDTPFVTTPALPVPVWPVIGGRSQYEPGPPPPP